MTVNDPMMEFLGVAQTAGPRAVLGLGEGPVDRATIEAALIMRQKKVDAHPEAGSPRASEVREILRLSATAVLAASRVTMTDKLPPRRESSASITNNPTPPSRIKPPARVERGAPIRPNPSVTEAHLTSFDRMVLAVLLAGGGWNNQTRAVLTGLAAEAGLDAANLHRVVIGLSGFVREHGSKGTVDSAAELPMMPPPARAPGRVEQTVVRIGEGLGREVRGENHGSLFRIIAICLLVAMVLGFLLVGLLSTPPEEVRSLAARRETAAAKVAEDMQRERSIETESNSGHEIRPSTRPGVVLPAKYDRPPNFSRSQRPETSVFRLESTSQFLAEFDDLARRLELSPDRLAAQKRSVWSEAVTAGAQTWPLMSSTARQQYIDGLLTVLKQATDPAVAGSLVKAFEMDPKGVIDNRLEIWTRSFKGGMLALVAARMDLPAEVRTPAVEQLEAIFNQSSIGLNSRSGPFNEGAGRTLDAMVSSLIEVTGFDDDAIDALEAWELWLVAQEVVRNDQQLQRARVGVITAILESDRNLVESGEPVDLLGRMMSVVDWGPTGTDPISLREAFADWMENPGVSSVSMWVLCSLLDSSLRANWFTVDYIPAADANLDARRRLLRDIVLAWPEPTEPIARGNQVLVNSGILDEIDDMVPVAREQLQSAGSAYERMKVLLMATRLAEASALLVDEREEEALAILELVSRQIASDETGLMDEPLLVGRTGGPSDGEWAAEFEKVRNNQQESLAMVEALRSRSALASDLGPLDAKMFVEQVWRGTSSLVRSTARAILLENYINGPIVALELLDTSDRTSLNDLTLEFVESYTGESMPGSNDNDAELRMRTALARKVLGLLDLDRDPIERIADGVRAAMVGRLQVSAPEFRAPVGAGVVDVAIESANAIRAAAQARIFADPFPDTIEELDRIRVARNWLATSLPQEMVAALAAEADYLAYVVAADVPPVRGKVKEILERSKINRGRGTDALQQAVLTALAIVELERLRLMPRQRDPLGGVG